MNKTSPPNFVFIMTDTQGANALGCYGDAQMRTPRLDALAGQGVRFERAYSSCPVCTPARAGIFTGQFPHLAGAWANELPLAQTAHTMGQRFRDAGYRTPYMGKWHLSGQDYFDTGICPDGYEDAYWYDGRRYLAELTDAEVLLWRQGLSTTEEILKHKIPAEFTWGNRISKRAINFLRDDVKPGQPFCMTLSYDEPHGPCSCPAEYMERWKDFVYDAGPSKKEDLANHPYSHRYLAESTAHFFRPDHRMFYPPYFACNEFVDHEIGSVIDAVDRYAGDNTWIIFTSDHGSLMGGHGGMGGKGLVMYDDSARIPIIIRPPGSFRGSRGVVNRTLVSHVDLLPTMLELAGLKVPPILDGQSLTPQLLDEKHDAEKAVVVEWNRNDVDVNHSMGLYPVRCYIQAGYKLVINLFDTDELYDLNTDPLEMHNRIQDPAYAARRDALHDQLIDWMNEHRDPFRGPPWCDRSWHRSDRLTANGGAKGMPDDGYLPPLLDYMTGRPVAK